ILGRGEVALRRAPLAERSDHAADQLANASLALRGAERTAEVLRDDDVGRELRPRLRDLDVALLEDGLARFAREHRRADLALARVPASVRLADHAVWAHWVEVVGPTVARHARPQRLGRGVLVVAVDSPGWMQELQFLKHDLRERLNARLGRRAVRDLFLVLE